MSWLYLMGAFAAGFVFGVGGLLWLLWWAFLAERGE